MKVVGVATSNHARMLVGYGSQDDRRSVCDHGDDRGFSEECHINANAPACQHIPLVEETYMHEMKHDVFHPICATLCMHHKMPAQDIGLCRV